MNYKPIGDKVLIRKDKVDSKDSYETKSGIVVIDGASRHKGRVSLGEVIDFGDSFIDNHGSRVEIGSMLKPGDKVLYYHPAEIPLEDDLVLVRAIDIDAVVDLEDGDNISLR